MSGDRDDRYCRHCKRPKLDHYLRNEDGTIRYATLKPYPIELWVICQEERNFKASRYFDDVLQRIPALGPDKTPLTDLIVSQKFVKDAFIVGDYEGFNLHLKSFIYHYIEEKGNLTFGFMRTDVPGIRNIKFGEGDRSFSKWDDANVLIFNLNVEGYDNKADADHINELLDYRAARFLPIWFICNTAAIDNKNVPANVKAKIHNLTTILLDGGAAKPSGGGGSRVQTSIAGSPKRPTTQSVLPPKANSLANVRREAKGKTN